MTNQEAINIIEDVSVNTNCDNCFYKYDNTCEDCRVETALNIAIEALENQKTGHWIRWYEEVEHKTYTEGIPHCKCSECNKEYDPHTSLFIKYCSNCGAKMEGE